MGKGGFDPDLPLPSANGLCDCSGFVAWCLGLGRDQRMKWGMWLSSSDIWRDAIGPQTLFVRLASPIPGCVAVYPDTESRGVHREGHVGIVTVASPLRGVDCSAGGYGIRERSFSFFTRKRTLYCALRQDLIG